MSRCVWSLVLVTFCFVVVKADEETRRRAPNEDISSRITYPNDFLLQGQPEYYHHHHHEPYHQNRRDYQPYHDFRFIDNSERNKGQHDPPGDDFGFEEGEIEKRENDNSMKIPISFIRNINQYQYNVSDLLLNFVEGEEEEPPLVIRNRFAEDDGARNAAKIPKAAGCIPETKTVKLMESDDPSVLYIPQCTRIERCGGCCSHALLSCQPKETEFVTYQVIKTQYTGGKKLKYLGKEPVVLEKHISCKCDCKTKEEDCNKYQEYKESECRCACTNTDEEKKCSKNGAKKLWNPELCTCQCIDIFECTTGYSFDQIDCKCVPNTVRKRFTSNGRRGYVGEAEPVVPLD